jgi:hypothetical protein
MDENVRLLMEETDCEQGEAELALELSNHNLENAIRTIESLLRHIFALKGKITFPAKNLYGLILIVVNTKSQEILKLRTVVSYNPSIYENSPKMDWYALEKLIFSYRLDEGSIPDFTQEIEHKMRDYFTANKETLVKGNIQEISSLMNSLFAPEIITTELELEELNLAQFRKLPGEDFAFNKRTAVSETETGMIWLQVDLYEDEAGGKPANTLKEGDLVMSRISDTRDIAHYLAHLIGSKRDDDMIPLPAVVRKVSIEGDEAEIHVNYAPGIIGLARVKSDLRVKVVEEKTEPWWKKMLPWD